MNRGDCKVREGRLTQPRKHDEGCDRRVTWVPFTVFLSLGDKDNSLIIAPEGTTCDMRCKGKGIVSSPLSFRSLTASSGTYHMP